MGQSFWIDDPSTKDVTSACHRFGKYWGRVFVCDPEQNGHRIWLLKITKTDQVEDDLRKKIIERIKIDGGKITEGVLVNKMRGFSRSKLIEELKQMVEDQEIVLTSHLHTKRRTLIHVYSLK